MRHIQIIAALTFAASIAGAVPTPYLPVLGPSPLRFLSPQSPGAGTSRLPPLMMSDPVPPPAAVTNAVKPPVMSPPGTNALVLVPVPIQATNPPPAASITNNLPAAVPAPGTPAFPMVDSTDLGKSMTPQMLMQFFKHPGTTNQPNGSTSAVVLPLFTPPKPVGTPPSSTSTYTTP